jgi:hypothetical protein
MNEREKRKLGTVKDPAFNRGEQRSIYGNEGSQAVPVRPPGKGRLKRR